MCEGVDEEGVSDEGSAVAIPCAVTNNDPIIRADMALERTRCVGVPLLVLSGLAEAPAWRRAIPSVKPRSRDSNISVGFLSTLRRRVLRSRSRRTVLTCQKDRSWAIDSLELMCLRADLSVTSVSHVGANGLGFGWSRLDNSHRSEPLWWFHADVSGCLATYL